MNIAQRQALRRVVRFLYDAQRLRIQSEGRGKKKAAHAEVVLDADDVAVLDRLGGGLSALEAEALRECEKRVKAESIGRWLLAIRGVGPTLAGVFLSEIDIARAGTVSALWKFAGCDVVAGRAPRPSRGQKRPYNAFLKTKLLGVWGDCILKACVRIAPPAKAKKGEWTEAAWERAVHGESPEGEERAAVTKTPVQQERAVEAEITEEGERAEDEESPATPKRADMLVSPADQERAVKEEQSDSKERLVRRYVTGYARIYADYRWRLLHRVGPCMACAARTEATDREERAKSREATSDQERANAEKQPVHHERAVNREQPEARERACSNCNGTGRGPWGRSSAHRHRAAIRYMAKMFLRDMYIEWRTAEGLPVRPSYAEEKLGLRRHEAVS